MNDPAVQPKHYTRFKIEPRDFVHANNLSYVVGNIVKYVCRYGSKDGLRDLEKAKNYLEYLIAQEKAKTPAPRPGDLIKVHGMACQCPLCTGSCQR